MAPHETDTDFMAGLRAGNQQTWRNLVERVHQSLLVIARVTFFGSSGDHEDILQEVYAATWRLFAEKDGAEMIPEFHDLLKVMRTITRNKAVDRLRKQGRRVHTDGAEIPDVADESVLPAGSAGDAALAWKRLDDLEPPRPEIIRSQMHGESFSSIATRLAVTKNVVQKLYYTGLRQLADILNPPPSEA